MKKTMFLAALMGAVVLTAPATAAVTYTENATIGAAVSMGDWVSMPESPIVLTIDLAALSNTSSTTDIILTKSPSKSDGWGLRTADGTTIYGEWDGDWNKGSNNASYASIAALDTESTGSVQVVATVGTSGTYLQSLSGTYLYSASGLKSSTYATEGYKITNSGIVTAANVQDITYSDLAGSGNWSLSKDAPIAGGGNNEITIELNGHKATFTADTTLASIGAQTSAKGGGILVKEDVTLTSNINSSWHPGNIEVENGGKIIAEEIVLSTNATSNVTGAGSIETSSVTTGNGGKINTSIANFTVNGDVALNTTTATQGATNDFITVSGGNFHVTGDVSLNKAGTALNITGGTATVDGTISGVGTVNVGAGQTLTAGAIDGTKITLAAGSTIELGTDHDGTLTTSSMTVNGNATINADLVTANNSIITFTEGSVTLGCSVTFGTGTTIALGEAYVEDLTANGQVLLFSGVDGLDLENLKNVAVTIGGVNGILLAEVQGDGSYNIYASPEPATTTLSLLALAGLMARRKRH